MQMQICIREHENMVEESVVRVTVAFPEEEFKLLDAVASWEHTSLESYIREAAISFLATSLEAIVRKIEGRE